jgi:hypothetical protein
MTSRYPAHQCYRSRAASGVCPLMCSQLVGVWFDGVSLFFVSSLPFSLCLFKGCTSPTHSPVPTSRADGLPAAEAAQDAADELDMDADNGGASWGYEQGVECSISMSSCLSCRSYGQTTRAQWTNLCPRPSRTAPPPTLPRSKVCLLVCVWGVCVCVCVCGWGGGGGGGGGGGPPPVWVGVCVGVCGWVCMCVWICPRYLNARSLRFLTGDSEGAASESVPTLAAPVPEAAQAPCEFHTQIYIYIYIYILSLSLFFFFFLLSFFALCRSLAWRQPWRELRISSPSRLTSPPLRVSCLLVFFVCVSASSCQSLFRRRLFK